MTSRTPKKPTKKVDADWVPGPPMPEEIEARFKERMRRPKRELAHRLVILEGEVDALRKRRGEMIERMSGLESRIRGYQREEQAVKDEARKELRESDYFGALLRAQNKHLLSAVMQLVEAIKTVMLPGFDGEEDEDE